MDFKYDHSVYWPAMNKMADTKREAYEQRWIAGGKLIGEFENYLKGEDIPSLAQTQSSAKGEGEGEGEASK